MVEELDLYTGKLLYKDIYFTFAFDRSELRLIPPKEKENEIECEWMRKQLGSGVYTWGDPVPVGVDYLIGECNETRHRIIFLPKQGATLGLHNFVVHIPLVAYVICKYDRDLIDRMSVSCPEINYIHPVNQAITLTTPNEEFHNKGIVNVSTLDFDRTISITNGMPILRTSVDHGTAFDIAGKGIGSEISMAEAILLAAKYAPYFQG